MIQITDKLDKYNQIDKSINFFVNLKVTNVFRLIINIEKCIRNKHSDQLIQTDKAE